MSLAPLPSVYGDSIDAELDLIDRTVMDCETYRAAAGVDTQAFAHLHAAMDHLSRATAAISADDNAALVNGYARIIRRQVDRVVLTLPGTPRWRRLIRR